MDFASAGFTFESKHELKAEQALDAIAYVQSLDSRYASLPVITAGHSMGGKIAFYAASLDYAPSSENKNAISAVMALDPVNAGGGPCSLNPKSCQAYPVAPNVESGQRGVMFQMNEGTSSLIFRSEPDALTNPDAQFNAQYFYYGSDGAGLDAAPSPAFYYDLGDFAHAAYLPFLCSEEVQLMKRTMVAFLQQQIQRIDRTEYLTGTIIEEDVQSGYLVAVDSRE
jgi:pimeloyl-ACP methyl ester carboxylesterase